MLFVWIIVAIVVLAAIYVLITYNGLVSMRNRIENAWAQIDVQLKRRYDLIPNLVETVKGYAAHERGTLEAVVQARNMAMNAQGPQDQAAAENMITGALKSVFALSEAYPDLKANQNFLNLQEELTGTEGRIAYARQFYNDTVFKYNTKIQSVPSNVVANQFSFAEREYFEVDDAARGNVEVDFDRGSDRRSQRRRRRASAGPHPAALSDPPRTLTPACTTRSLRTSAAPLLLIARLRRPRAGGRRSRSTSSSAAARLHALRARPRGRDGGRVVLEVGRHRAAREPGSTSVRRGVRPAAQHRRGPLHRRRAAQAPPLHRRRPVAERLRHRARPEARRRGGHHRAAREDEPGRARGRARPRAEPHQELRHPRLHARRDDGGRHRHRRRHRRALHVVRHGAEPQQRQRQRGRRHRRDPRRVRVRAAHPLAVDRAGHAGRRQPPSRDARRHVRRRAHPRTRRD